MRWILQMYEKELMEKCGEMSIVEKNLLPLGILTILRKKKVACRWFCRYCNLHEKFLDEPPNCDK